MGSTSLVINGGGEVLWVDYFKPFGSYHYTWSKWADGSVPTNRQTDYRFTGQRQESEIKLYDYVSRWYDYRRGRFAQADTIVPEPGNPQDLNRYSYTRNNPVKFIDPSGHCPTPPDEMGATICVALFIMPETVMGGIHGDGRNFSNASNPDESRGYIWISLDEQNNVVSVMNPSGYTFAPEKWLNENADGLIWTQPSENNQWSVVYGDDGEISVEYDLVISGPLEGVAPHINGTIVFQPDANGNISYTMDRDGFPWAEAYYHDGEGEALTVFQDPAVRGNPYDLYGIEPHTGGLGGVLSRSFQWVQEKFLGPPITSRHLAR